MGKNADGEDVDALHEESDEGIEVTNSFDGLNDVATTAPPPRKKLNQASNAIRVVNIL